MSNQLFVRVADPETKIFTGCHYEDPNYKLKDNETLEAIPDGLRPPYKLVNGNWVGASEEEFDQSFPLPEGLKEANELAKQKQLSQQQFTASMLKKVATLTVDNATQAQVNVNAIKDIAKLKIELAKLTVQSSASSSASESNSASVPASSSASEPNPASASASQLTSGNESVSQSVSNTTSMEGVSQNV
ncbi:hypothetical protein [Limosilactobacillus fermentum]|uniref:hypothetical protein n=1 Tax=Limosilactobacillus fermentum TaxID=1613 RepID=UPI001C0CBF3E|nr:hypothetical protein [Limosilactobacillus fermentum]QWQ34278.1 hypothetical protein KOM17_03765 [Limosilactobacillus fermentum]